MESNKPATETTKAVSAAAPAAAAPAAVVAAPAPKAVAKPAPKALVKAPAKVAAKPVLAKKPLAAPKKASSTAAVAKPVAKPLAKPAAKPVAKPAAKPVAKPVAKAETKAAAKPLADKLPKDKKVKMVRDSISIPKTEYLVLDTMKVRAGKLAVHIKKTELIRAGIKLLAALPDPAFQAALRAVPSLKTGRPAKSV